MAVEASDHDLEKEYWGYQVFISSSLCDFLTMQVKKKLILLTSRNGKNLKENESSFKDLLISYNNNLLIVYGSPNKDLNEICKHLTDVIGNRSAMYVNLFSEQQTGSIRLEEAILGSLSIVNYILK
jgi:predicted SPOUT superfamily RNA methylase MTH1